MKREPFKMAGQKVKIKNNVQGFDGMDFVIEDYWENVSGHSWMSSTGNPAAIGYAVRCGSLGLPIDNEVVYGKIGMMGCLFHVTELEIPE